MLKAFNNIFKISTVLESKIHCHCGGLKIEILLNKSAQGLLKVRRDQSATTTPWYVLEIFGQFH
jgi:hypothetical protein